MNRRAVILIVVMVVLAAGYWLYQDREAHLAKTATLTAQLTAARQAASQAQHEAEETRRRLVELQQASAKPRFGVLGFARAPVGIAWIGPSDATEQAPYIAAFKEGLRDNGVREGKDYIVDAQYGDGRDERIPLMVDEALKHDPAVFIVVTIASMRAAQKATQTVPIVFVPADELVGSAVITTLARPGGNTTGISNSPDELIGRRVQLLHDVLPHMKRIAVLLNPGNPTNTSILEQVRGAAQHYDLSADVYEVASSDLIDPALARIAQQRPDALLQIGDAMLFQHRARIASFALKERLPSISTSREDAQSGFLMAYGADRPDMYRRAATYVRNILAGARPSDLPVEHAVKFGLGINMKTAQALGLTFPRELLLRAEIFQ